MLWSATSQPTLRFAKLSRSPQNRAERQPARCLSDVRIRPQFLFCMIDKDTLNKLSWRWAGAIKAIYLSSICKDLYGLYARFFYMKTITIHLFHFEASRWSYFLYSQSNIAPFLNRFVCGNVVCTMYSSYIHRLAVLLYYSSEFTE